MKLALILIFAWMFTDSLGQSLDQILRSSGGFGENLPSGVYVSDLCDECTAYGLDEFKIGGGNMFDKRSYRDFRVMALWKKANYLNVVTDQIENCSVVYVLYVDRDVFLKELKKIEESKIKVGTNFITKEPFQNGSQSFDLTISVVKWPFRNLTALRYGFLVVASPAKKITIFKK